MTTINYIGISRDHSASMRSIARPAARDYNSNIQSIKSAAQKNKIETYVSVVECGYGTTDRHRLVALNEAASNLQPISEHSYSASGYGTPLFDSVGALIAQFEAVEANTPKSVFNKYEGLGKEELRQACRDAKISYSKLNNDGMRQALTAATGGVSKANDVSFLVMAVTDGEDNASHEYPSHKLAEKIRKLQATDRWTFVFRVPRGYTRHLISLGIPAGNILEWDQTEKGVEVASRATTQAFDTYYTARSRGETMTKSFYQTDLSTVSKATVKAKLVDISKDVKFYEVQAADQIKTFIKHVTKKDYVAGTAFYQLTKKEDEVQDYKQIAIRDKKSGHVYSGVEARNILGLPHNGTVKVAPGNHGSYDIFIQSTSVNRKLMPGTQIMHWSKVGV